jgi:hypothetical protein
MPRKRRNDHTPKYGTFFWSVQEYQDVMPEHPELVTLYARDRDGVWHANGEFINHEEVPSDLWDVRFVMR